MRQIVYKPGFRFGEAPAFSRPQESLTPLQAIRWGVDYALDRQLGGVLFASPYKPLVLDGSKFRNIAYEALSGARWAYATGAVAEVQGKCVSYVPFIGCLRRRLETREVMPWEWDVKTSGGKAISSLITEYRVPTKKENFDPIFDRALSSFDPSNISYALHPSKHALTDEAEINGIIRELFRRRIFPEGVVKVVAYPLRDAFVLPMEFRNMFVEYYRNPSLWEAIKDFAAEVYRFLWKGSPKGICVSPLLWESYRNYWALTEHPEWRGHAVLKVYLPSFRECRLFEELAYGFPDASIVLSNAPHVMQMAEAIYYMDGSIDYESQSGYEAVKAIVQEVEDALVGMYGKEYDEDAIRKALHLALVRIYVLNPRIQPIPPVNDPRKLYGYKDVYAFTLGAKNGFRFRIEEVIKAWKKNAIIERGFSLLTKILLLKIMGELSEGRVVVKEGGRTVVKQVRPLKISIPAGVTPDGKVVRITNKEIMTSLKAQIGAEGAGIIATLLSKPMSTDEFISYMKTSLGMECGFYPVKPTELFLPAGRGAERRGIPFVLIAGLAALVIAATSE